MNKNKKQYNHFDKYKKYIEIFDMSEEEITFFLYNYCDAVAFNDYLFRSNRYLNFDFNSENELLKLIDFFKSNNIDKKIAKEILISMPMILSCDDLEKDLELIYKGDKLEGIVIYDEKDNCYPYRKTKKLRNIMQNYSFLEDLKVNKSTNNNYQKAFYTMNSYRNVRKR